MQNGALSVIIATFLNIFQHIFQYFPQYFLSWVRTDGDEDGENFMVKLGVLFHQFIFEKFRTEKSVVLNFVTLRLCCCGIFCLRLCCCGIFCKQMVLSVSVHCGRTGHASAISKQRTETEFPKYFSVHTFFRSDPPTTAITITKDKKTTIDTGARRQSLRRKKLCPV